MEAVKPRPLEQFAQVKSEALIDHILDKNGNWLPKKWDGIFRTLCQEGQHVRVAGPCAVVTYAKYVAIAALYLNKFPNDVDAYWLRHRVNEDLAKLDDTLRRLPTHVFTANEMIQLNAAKEQIKTTLDCIPIKDLF